ncbi:unnamed protein product, partial [marine sediment metagenome]
MDIRSEESTMDTGSSVTNREGSVRSALPMEIL